MDGESYHRKVLAIRISSSDAVESPFAQVAVFNFFITRCEITNEIAGTNGNRTNQFLTPLK